jgi:hypothetical protein
MGGEGYEKIQQGRVVKGRGEGGRRKPIWTSSKAMTYIWLPRLITFVPPPPQ